MSHRDTDQLDRFKDAARELGCDEDETAFDDTLRHIAKAKPKPPEKAKATKQKAPE